MCLPSVKYDFILSLRGCPQTNPSLPHFCEFALAIGLACRNRKSIVPPFERLPNDLSSITYQSCKDRLTNKPRVFN